MSKDQVKGCLLLIVATSFISVAWMTSMETIISLVMTFFSIILSFMGIALIWGDDSWSDNV